MREDALCPVGQADPVPVEDHTKLNGWLGEVEGLESSLTAASGKLVSLDRMRERQPSLPPGAIGVPVIVAP